MAIQTNRLKDEKVVQILYPCCFFECDFRSVFWAIVSKTVRPRLSDR